MISRRGMIGGVMALSASPASAVSYRGKFIGSTLRGDTSLPMPVTVAADFFGLTNSSFGAGITPTSLASAHCSGLDIHGQPVWIMDAGGSGYYNADSTYGSHVVVAAISSGGGATTQGTFYPVVRQSDGAITGVVQTTSGNYTSPPTIAFPTQGGPDIPRVPTALKAKSRRLHDQRGSIPGDTTHYSIRNTKWDYWSNGDGTYKWATLDEAVCWCKAIGSTVMFTLCGTPAAYTSATSAALNDAAGSNGPLTGVPPAADLTGATLGFAGLQQDVTALMTRYCTNNPAGLVNPLTGGVFAAGTKFIDYFETWNEPKLGVAGAAQPGVSGTYFVGSAQQLVDLMRVAYRAVKAVNPAVLVTGPAFVLGDIPDVASPIVDQFHDPYAVLSAVDTVEGKAGYLWLDEVSFHPYDGVNKGSPWLVLPHTLDVEQKIMRYRRMFASLSAAIGDARGVLPISVTECGALDVVNPFFAAPLNDYQRGIYLKRQYAILAALGVTRVYMFDFRAAYMGFASNSAPIIAALIDASNALPGRTITGIERGIDGSFLLTFNGGAQWWTG